MKTKTLAILAAILSSHSFAQSGGGEFKFKSTECLSDEERTEIKKTIAANQQMLQEKGILKANKALVPPPFIWPVKKSATSPYNENWSISNYVDHNPNYPNQIQDWNCGTRTYDSSNGYNHAGIDIFTWPFGWYQMDNSQAEIIAAAPGIIINKYDGNYDRRCAMSNLNWNAVYVQHNDGSVAWYGHMKNGSLTSKAIGENVAVGEYLGIVGSSGNSTGPHLHFEVYNSSNALVDPYQGPCNTWTSSSGSWWQTQKPYQDPKINGILTHSAQVVLDNGCGVQETTNFKNAFNAGEHVFTYIYLSDILVGSNVNMKLIRPDNTLAYDYNFTMDTFYAASYWYWDFPSNYFNQNGNWKTSVTVGSQTVTHDFTYGITSATQEIKEGNLQIKNPVKNGILEIVSERNTGKTFSFELYSADGKLLKKSAEHLGTGINRLPFDYSKGNYLLKVSSENYQKTFKVINN